MTIDPIALKLAEIVLKWGWDKGTSQIEKINFNKSVTKAKLDHACKAYIDNYRHRYGKISVLVMPKPADLENIYTNVQIIEGRNLWKYKSLQDQEQAYRDAARRSFQSDKCQKQDGIGIANKYQYLMVLGQPGAGKSTLLKRIGLAALQDHLPGLQDAPIEPQSDKLYLHELIPVLIELKRWDSSRFDLVNKIQSELEIGGFESADMLTQTILTRGGMLILLDGLDEIPSQHLDSAITQIQDFVNKYKDNRFIISCRTAAYQGGFNNLVNVEMAEFDDEQIQQFISNWFCREQDLDVAVADVCWTLLNSDGYQATKELAHTPLLLTFLCLVYDASQAFPKNRAALYKSALNILLSRWAAEKRIQRDPIYKDLPVELEEMLLAKIAYEQFSLDRLFFDKQEVIREIRKYLTENLNAPQHLNGENVLRAIQIQQGILVERSSYTLSFSHLTLQEYLTAQYIVDRQVIDELISQHLTDHRWREVFLLVAGLMRNKGDVFLEKMAINANQLLNTQKLRDLVNLADETTKNVRSQISPLARRHLALSIANAVANAISNAIYNKNTSASAYAYTNTNDDNLAITNAYANASANAIDIANAIANAYANAYANANAKAYKIANAKSISLIDNLSELQIFNQIDYTEIKNKIQELEKHVSEQTSEDVYRKFTKIILQVWCQSLRLELSWLNLSELELNNLDRYFTANLLIMECKDAAVYISAKGWMDVENKMFRIGQIESVSTNNLLDEDVSLERKSAILNQLTDLEIKRLEKKRDDLQYEWDVRQDCTTKLRHDLVIEVDASTKIKLTKQIEDGEKELSQLEEKLKKIEDFINSGLSIYNSKTSIEQNSQ
jgi:predicted NACHT family NTPase